VSGDRPASGAARQTPKGSTEPHLEQVGRVLGRQRGHEAAAPGGGVDEPLGLEHAQGFPDRVARHPQLLGQPVLDQPFALSEGAVEDQPPNLGRG
jgi:hypothetical protein